MVKVKNGTAPKIISDIFRLSNPTYNLKNKRDFVSNHENTVYFGTESLSYLVPKLCDLLPQDLKTLTSLTQFKSQVKIGFRKTTLAESAKNVGFIYKKSYFIYLIFIYLFI